MMLRRKRPRPEFETQRLALRLPEMTDHGSWVRIRRAGESFLRPWEPEWAPDHFSRKSFRSRVNWAWRTREEGRALALFLTLRDSGDLAGAITLDNVRRGPSQAGSVGYWIGPEYARQGLMSEALAGLVNHAFKVMDLGRIEAACLPENLPSRGLLERSGFVHEGMAGSYLQIGGKWRDHVLYANVRPDRASGDETN